jgi:PAS domain S-box-containing protein
MAAGALLVTTTAAATTTSRAAAWVWLLLTACALAVGAVARLPNRAGRRLPMLRLAEPLSGRRAAVRGAGLVSTPSEAAHEPAAASHQRLVRRVTEQALRNVREHYEIERAFDFLANTEEAVCVTDDSQRIVLWNAAACRMLGHRARDVLGRSCFEVLGGCDGSGARVCRWRCPTREALRHGELPPTRELLVRRAQGGRLRVSATTIVFRSGWLAHLMRPC